MGTKGKILIAEDNMEFCSNVKDILELEGFEADSVHNGIENQEKRKFITGRIFYDTCI